MDLTLDVALQEKVGVYIPAQSKAKGWLKKYIYEEQKEKNDTVCIISCVSTYSLILYHKVINKEN